MLEQAYKSLRKELTTEGTFNVSNVNGVLTVVVESLFFTIGLILLIHTPRFLLFYWILQIFLGVSIFRFFVILHECGHKNLFHQRYLNNIVGSLVSPICFHPYIPWRNIHNEHHKWAGIIDKDPTLAHLLKLKESSKSYGLLRFIWMFWIPIGVIKVNFQIYWMYPFNEFKKGNTAKAWSGLVSVLITGLPHLLLIGYLGIAEYLTLFAPMILIFWVWTENMNLPHHAGLFPYLSQYHPTPIPYYEQDYIARTTYLPSILSVLFAYNFNFHVEHHLFPGVPWYNLPKVTQKIKNATDVQYNEVEFFKFMVNLRGQDIIDVYVKSLPSEIEKEVSVQS